MALVLFSSPSLPQYVTPSAVSWKPEISLYSFLWEHACARLWTYLCFYKNRISWKNEFLSLRETLRKCGLLCWNWRKQYSLLCLYNNQCFSLLLPLPELLAHVCVYVCVFYSLGWPAVGCSSVHIKSLAFSPGWSWTRCKVLCGSSAFLKASSRSCGFW